MDLSTLIWRTLVPLFLSPSVCVRACVCIILDEFMFWPYSTLVCSLAFSILSISHQAKQTYMHNAHIHTYFGRSLAICVFWQGAVSISVAATAAVVLNGDILAVVVCCTNKRFPCLMFIFWLFYFIFSPLHTHARTYAYTQTQANSLTHSLSILPFVW